MFWLFNQMENFPNVPRSNGGREAGDNYDQSRRTSGSCLIMAEQAASLNLGTPPLSPGILSTFSVPRGAFQTRSQCQEAALRVLFVRTITAIAGGVLQIRY